MGRVPTGDRGIILALALGVFLPVLLSTAVGIVALALGDDNNFIVTGVLILSFAATAIGGGLAAVVLLRKRSRRLRLQTDLVANVSHDLRTPVTTIRIYTQLLLAGKVEPDEEKRRDYLETIERETRWLEAGINRILAWRSVSRDRDVMEFHVQPISETLRATLNRFSQMVRESEVVVQEDLECDALVNQDQEALGSAILNLLINAYKYSPVSPVIRLGCRVESRHVLVTVTDNGLGIPKKQRKKIFQPFYRISRAREDSRASGVGLGLAIVLYTVQQHKGDIQVFDAPGRGSVFQIRLPLVQ